jgi:hypothetical protein
MQRSRRRGWCGRTSRTFLGVAVFVLVNVTYLALCWEAVDRPSRDDVSNRVRRMLRMRSFFTVLLFAAVDVEGHARQELVGHSEQHGVGHIP